MPTAEKEQVIAEFKERVGNSQIAIAASYIGLTAAQSSELRSKLRAENVVFKVYKNTLVTRALNELGLDGATAYLKGPTAWAFSADPVAPAKVLKTYGKAHEQVAMNGGILGEQLLDPNRLEALADLPPREQLIAQTVGTIAMPLRNFVSVMAAPIRNFVNVVEQIRKQKEEQEGGAAA